MECVTYIFDSNTKGTMVGCDTLKDLTHPTVLKIIC